MKVLIIAAHGSRKEAANREVKALAQRLIQKTAGGFDRVETAFLQFAEPLLEAKIQALIREGADRMIIFPLFIAAGSHVLSDIPKIVEKALAAHRDLDIRITPHLGKIEAVDEIILQEVMGPIG